MVEFEILVQGLYLPDQLNITYDPSLCMSITPAIQQWMDTLWQEKLAIARQRGFPLFDAPLFRLIHAESRPDGTLSLVLGNTSYKEYVTTRGPEGAHECISQGRDQSDPSSNALAVCSVVETSDGYILLDKRQGVDVYNGRYHVIGGFFQRELDMTTHPDPFQAIRREIREETGIQPDDIQEQYCLGVVYDLATPHPEICFLTRLNIALAEVEKRTPEEDEIKELQSLAVTSESLRDFVLSNHGNISATGEPNVLLYGALEFGEGWYEELIERLKSLE